MVKVVESSHVMMHDPDVMRLVREMLAGNVSAIKPALNLATEEGFTYPQVENLLAVTTQRATAMMEFLASENVLGKEFYDKLLSCPHCHSLSLRPTLHCSKCNSKNITRRRTLKHLSCGNIEAEDKYMVGGKYICPECKTQLRSPGNDYISLGFNYHCYNCGAVSNEPVLKWQCLKCSSAFVEDEARETFIYAYRLNERRRQHLEFDLISKVQFIEFLKQQGYEVAEKVKVNSSSKSGAEHIMDILAQQDDGFIAHTIGIGIAINREGGEVGLDEVFRFDDRAYDMGFHDKVLLVVPMLSREAKQFAQQQRIRVFEGKELDAFLASVIQSASRPLVKEPLEFETKESFLKYLRNLGYKVEEKARMQGRSEAEYTLDIVAHKDDGFIIHTVGIDIIISAVEGSIGLDAVTSFDAKAYDIGLHEKVLLVSPKLSKEAGQFARQQRIKVIEVDW